MKTGKTVGFRLVRLAAKYNEMQKNGRLLSNRQSIEILRTRITQLCERIDQNEAPDRLFKLQKLWEEYNEKEQRGEKLEAVKVRHLISAEFEKAYHDYAAWKQMFEALDLDRKLVESEVKVAKDIKAILTAEDAYEMVAKLLAAIISAVNDANGIPPDVKGRFLKRIEFEFTTLVGDGLDRFANGEEVIEAEANAETEDAPEDWEPPLDAAPETPMESEE